MKVFGEVEKLIDRDLKAALDVKVQAQAQTTRGINNIIAYLCQINISCVE